MAVIDEVGVEVTVRANGHQLPEYYDPHAAPAEDNEDDNLDPYVCTKYVESIDNAKFDIRCTARKTPESAWTRGHAKSGFVAKTFVDGRYIEARVMQFTRDADAEHYIFNGLPTSTGSSRGVVYQSFIFSPVTTIDTAEKARVEKDTKAAKELGTITVKLFLVDVNGYGDWFKPSHTAGTTGFSLAEKALKGKALSHGTSYAPPNATSHEIRCMKVEYHNSAPIAIFNLHYRSRQALQREMIIPRSPSPEPADEVLGSLSPGRINQLARERLLQLQDKKPKQEATAGVKREVSDVYDLTGEGVVPMPPRKASRNGNGQREAVIDLTDD